jgi:aminocarboxymuconate-semialdehyde decarboxylase
MAAAHATPVVDVHAHFFPRELDGTGAIGNNPLVPSLVVDSPESGRIVRDGLLFRDVRAELWDVDRRIAELDRVGIQHQVISPVPVLLQYAVTDGRAMDLACIVNDATAAAVDRSAGRLIGLGTVPLPGSSAVPELRRAVEELGLAGVEIGTNINGIELDDPELLGFFEAAEALEAAVFVHPMDGGNGVLRRDGVPYGFGLGMMTDTALAATALVFGGVLERFPGLRVGLAHGCGTFPWALPRLELGNRLLGQATARPVDELVRSLWVDSLVFDPAHLRLLVDRFGADHVMLGSDHPFLPDHPEASIRDVADARDRGILTEDETRMILGRSALAFVGRGKAAMTSHELAGTP